jgi:hypothetical protein
MERLPYIDEHAKCVGATRERTWAALLAVGAELGRGANGPLARLTRLQPALRSGDWSGALQAGATVPGFAVEEARSPSRLALAVLGLNRGAGLAERDCRAETFREVAC